MFVIISMLKPRMLLNFVLAFVFVLFAQQSNASDSLETLDRMLSKAILSSQWERMETDIQDWAAGQPERSEELTSSLQTRLSIASALTQAAVSDYFSSLSEGKPPAPDILQLLGNALDTIQATKQVEDRSKQGNDILGLQRAVERRFLEPLRNRKAVKTLQSIAPINEGTLVAQFVSASKKLRRVRVFDLYLSEDPPLLHWSSKTFPSSKTGERNLEALTSYKQYITPDARLVLYADISAIGQINNVMLAIDELLHDTQGKISVSLDNVEARETSCFDRKVGEYRQQTEAKVPVPTPAPGREAGSMIFLGEGEEASPANEKAVGEEPAPLAFKLSETLGAQFKRSCKTDVALDHLPGEMRLVDPELGIVIEHVQSEHINFDIFQRFLDKARYLAGIWP